MEGKVFIKDKDVRLEELGEGLSRKILGYNKDIMMVKVIFEKGAVGALHSHPHSQTTYIESGSFEVEIDNEKKILKEGDAFFIPPNVKHGVVALEKSVLIDVFNPVREDFLH